MHTGNCNYAKSISFNLIWDSKRNVAGSVIVYAIIYSCERRVYMIGHFVLSQKYNRSSSFCWGDQWEGRFGPLDPSRCRELVCESKDYWGDQRAAVIHYSPLWKPTKHWWAALKTEVVPLVSYRKVTAPNGSLIALSQVTKSHSWLLGFGSAPRTL